ncbi:Protein of unknown function [Ekhidna lutea]|uniref:DinB superfamily protein n=1 Tax=Ekhidna lutea TaxID=447679 RepID=A0A239K2C2_EKHLU|nr:DUF1572 family protein [Ekhidna lutea]SNT12536.1 Protein of unknown function [Ekhidna lutea]
MHGQEFNKLFQRDLDKLMTEMESYPNYESLWVKVEGINNSAGNLIMHLCGNLQHFIGAQMAKSGYVRERDFEFAGKLSFDELKNEINTTKKVLDGYFTQMNSSSLDDKFPIDHFGHPVTNRFFLMHLQGHLNYHLGQINYHRRILS